MEIKFASRMDAFQPGIFSLLNDRKNQRISEGKPVWNLSVGTPDFSPDAHVIAAMEEAVRHPVNYTYALADLPELTQAVQNWYLRRYGVSLTAEQITSVNGSQEGLAHIAWTLCDPGDVVLVPNPGYPIFEVGPRLCGAEPVYYDLREENGYLPDLEAIPADIRRRAKAMIVSYPANPICKTAPRHFYEQLVDFARENQIVIIHDNAYSEIVYDGRECGSFLSVPGAMEVGVEFNSLSKSYCLTGGRISFVLGNREIVRKFATLRSQIDYGIFRPVQLAGIAALNGPQDGVKWRREEYQRRRDALCGGLRSVGWPVPDSEGSMFAWAPLPKGCTNSVDFCFELLERTGLLCTPGSSFGPLGEGHVRFALVLPPEEMARIAEAVGESGILQS
ncbi:MAG: aminotransferase class I/II-fold pyridoxal phosphate-dependent enzyme [Clostridiales bacterium]|nr:aminotransferase class I/II-fold pyridoxal phosphate-dependent enzyme [Clostridiales bacterium]